MTRTPAVNDPSHVGAGVPSRRPWRATIGASVLAAVGLLGCPSTSSPNASELDDAGTAAPADGGSEVIVDAGTDDVVDGGNDGIVDAVDGGSEEGLACNKARNLADIPKPTGAYASVITPNAVTNAQFRGGLVRVTWAELEPTPGAYNFAGIDSRLALLPVGTQWTLAVHGGWTDVDENDPDLFGDATFPNGQPRPTIPLEMSPPWLVDDLGAATFATAFRQVDISLPKYWDPVVQTRLATMMGAVAERYGSDPSLQLVYVPQMTVNGLEGHFNGVDDDVLLRAADINPADADAGDQFQAIWVEAALNASKSVAAAFPTKAIAFEVHEVIGRVSIPQAIMTGLLDDADFGHRAGVAMWWISGDATDYQPDLVDALRAYEGDLYGQVIGQSNEADRFPDGDYTRVFQQAQDLCMRYIEPWNQEFEQRTHDDDLAAFNAWSDASFQ